MNSTLHVPIYQIFWRVSTTMESWPLLCGGGVSPRAEWRAIDCAWWVGPSCSLTCRTHATNQVEPRRVFSGSKMIDDWLVRLSFLSIVSRHLAICPYGHRKIFEKWHYVIKFFVCLCVCVFFCEIFPTVFLVKYTQKAYAYSKSMDRLSSVGITTRYGLDGPVSNPGGCEIFRNRPDRLWCPPSLLYNGYRISFPGSKRSERGVEHGTSSSAELYLCSSFGPSWLSLGWTLAILEFDILS
jgi:hypothetical protein